MTLSSTSRTNLSPTRKETCDWILEALCWIGLAVAFYPLLHWNDLGSETLIPIHFNMQGEADGWGGRSSLLILPIMAILFYVGLSVAEKYYRKFNYPIRVTDYNKDTLYRLSIRMIRFLKPELIFIFAYLNNASYHSAYSQSSVLNAFILGIMIVLLLATLFFFLINMAACKND